MKSIRLLTIGNSFSNNALTYLERIAAGTDAVRFDVGRASLGGCSLEKHWNLATYTARQPDFGTYELQKDDDGQPVMVSLQKALVARPWDVISLQQVSHQSWRRDTFEPWLGQLLDLVHGAAPQAKVMLHQTWAYRCDTPYYAVHAITPETMHQRIRANYRHFASRYNCGILASGDALYRARQTEGCTYTWPDPDYDYQDAEAPALPYEPHSLAAGWHWQITQPGTGIPVLALDANHLNGRGCYLCSNLWFEKLTGLSAHDSAFAPDDLDTDDAAWLRDIAHETVAGLETEDRGE